MKRPALLLASAALFAVWIGYLVYLVTMTRAAVVLSRPQLLAADLIVTARVEGDKGPVVVEVHRAAAGAAPAVGDVLDVRLWNDITAGWKGDGRYLLPLTREPGGTSYHVTPIPRSPGYARHERPIYPATPKSEAELKAIL